MLRRCVAFKSSPAHELLFVAETNAEAPPRPPTAHMQIEPPQAPPFTVKLWMWIIPRDLASADRLRIDKADAAMQARPRAHAAPRRHLCVISA